LLNPDFRDILSAFIDHRVEFLVVVGYAMAAHRLPRATKDLDLWVRPEAENAARVLEALDAFGAPRHGLIAEDLASAGTIYQVGVPPHRVDVITGPLGPGAWVRCIAHAIPGLDATSR